MIGPLIVIGPGASAQASPCIKAALAADLGILSPYVKPQTRNLGVIFNSNFCFDKQIAAVVNIRFFIAKMKPHLSFHNLEIVIHAFIRSRLDYCNSLYLGLPQLLLSRLQLVQNSAARLLTGSSKRDHITPILASLHWLPIQHRIHLKPYLGFLMP